MLSVDLQPAPKWLLGVGLALHDAPPSEPAEEGAPKMAPFPFPRVAQIEPGAFFVVSTRKKEKKGVQPLIPPSHAFPRASLPLQTYFTLSSL